MNHALFQSLIDAAPEIPAMPGQGIPAMSSLEIARITGKEHRIITRDIRLMLISLYGEDEVEKTVPEQYRNRHSEYVSNNAEAIFKKVFETFQDGPNLDHPKTFQSEHGFSWSRDARSYICEFYLDYQHTLTLTSGYSVKLRKAIIDRWHELEAKQSFFIPQSLPEALRLAADLADKVDQQSKQLAIAAPKVAFHDAVTESNEVCQLAIAAQVAKLPFGRNILFQKLRELGVLISGGERHNLPKQEFIKRGLFTVNERKFERPDTGEPIVTFTTYATQKGIAWIINQFTPTPQ